MIAPLEGDQLGLIGMPSLFEGDHAHARTGVGSEEKANSVMAMPIIALRSIGRRGFEALAPASVSNAR